MTAQLEIDQIAAQPTRAWRLQSDAVSLVVDESGARISEVVIRSDDGPRLVSVDDDKGNLAYHGASIGRWANRIAQAQFEFDGRRYELAANEGEHLLHGGRGGFHTRRWLGQASRTDDRAVVALELTSPYGDQGFPGELDVIATVALSQSTLTIDYRATTTAVTPVNLTNHLYWNLGGPGSLDGHHLTVAADRYLAIDNDKIPVAGPPADVDGSAFDCRTARQLDDIVEAGGYDHCFVLRTSEGGPMTSTPAVVLSHVDGPSISVTTNQMGVQVYTGQHLDPQRRAIAIEPQRLPDMVNRPDFGDPFLRPGTEYHSTMSITFSP